MKRLFFAAVRPVFGLLLTTLLNIGLCSLIFELLEDGDDHGPIGQIYWGITTATTTGYGDLSPETLVGRIVAMWLMVSSVILLAIFTAQITAALVEDPHLFSHEEQEELKDDNEDILVMCVLICDKLGLAIPETVEEAPAILEQYRNNGRNTTHE